MWTEGPTGPVDMADKEKSTIFSEQPEPIEILYQALEMQPAIVHPDIPTNLYRLGKYSVKLDNSI